jgi:hypothetical protein
MKKIKEFRTKSSKASKVKETQLKAQITSRT